MQTAKEFVWHSEVRAYELDYQSVVNNAIYLNYYDEARVNALQLLNIDWNDWKEQGFHFVVISAQLHYKLPLVGHDKFYITSQFSLGGRIRLCCQQQLFRTLDNRLLNQAEIILTCLNTKTKRPCMPDAVIANFNY